ncbi:MAG: hypothetical protein CVU95_00900 [Firmicutes bacterium HGW-Firmicutes-2]|nr:MAG: hypothetical protein CVU95_00900 [Firmicutes bacterium HGW-Firmicutes-2]
MTKEEFVAIGLTEDMATKAAEASQTELKGFIPKVRFDEVNDAKKKAEDGLKERDTQIETLKKTSGDSETLKAQIEELQKANKEADEKYQADLKETRLSSAIKLALTGKVHDDDLVAGLFDKTKLILGDDGKVTGLDEQLSSIKESKAFLFKTENNQNQNQNQGAGFRVGANNNQNQNNSEGQEGGLKSALSAHFQQSK